MIGGAGTSVASPETPVYLNVSVLVMSRSRPTKTVSLRSASKGTEGVESSSRARLYQESAGDVLFVKLPIRPTSDDVLSPVKSRKR